MYMTGGLQIFYSVMIETSMLRIESFYSVMIETSMFRIESFYSVMIETSMLRIESPSFVTEKLVPRRQVN
jgi:hypothetical protein